MRCSVPCWPARGKGPRSWNRGFAAAPIASAAPGPAGPGQGREGLTMSGHSKWATTKYRKGAQDAARAKVFAKLIRQVEVAAREGGSDMTANANLRAMYQKARDASVGVAVIVETLTDNRNRTGAEIRNLFTRNGGSMAEPGAVSWQFERKAVLTLPRSLDEDLTDGGGHWVLTAAPHDLVAVRDALDAAGLAVESAELTLEPTSTVQVPEEGEAKKILRLLEAIDDHDDVQAVHANYDIPDEVLAGFDG